MGTGEDTGGARLIDLHFQGHAGLIASHVLESPEGLVVVDPGPPSTLGALLGGLERAGARERDICALLATHIHVDHSGAAGALARRNPALRVYVHEKGAPHLAAPERLLDYVAKLYRDPGHSSWGLPEPVPPRQLVALAGGETLDFGGRALEVRYAPGHARHHVIFLDRAAGSAYTGDAAGVMADCCPAVLPYAPPPDISLEAWRETLAWLEDARPERLMLTHFGPVRDPARHLDEFRRRLALWTAEARTSLEAEEQAAAAGFARFALEELRAAGHAADEPLLALICQLPHCWMGLARALGRRIAL
jgi:glyoxylase-like metal-dependent hydrolase (beta-lactamase superfamily II)